VTGAHVIGLGLWTPGFPSVKHWADHAESPEATSPACDALPRRAKRGTSLVTRMAVEVAEQAANAAGADLAHTSNVFGSALGEVQTAIDQMAMIASDDGLLSPTRFKNSVHNTAPGLLSIAVENRGFTTAIAGGPATVAMSLLEGLSLLETEGGRVVVAVADEPVPEPFVEERRYAPLALGLCLAPEDEGQGSLAFLTGFGRRKGPDAPGGGEIPDHLAANPIASGLPLFAAILGGEGATNVPVERGVAEPYSVEVRAPDNA